MNLLINLTITPVPSLSSQGDLDCTLYISTDLSANQNHTLTLSDRIRVLFKANHHNCKVNLRWNQRFLLHM